MFRSTTDGSASHREYALSGLLINDDIESAILKNIGSYDMVCVGVSEQRAVSKILRGSLAEQIVEHAPGNVSLVRDDQKRHRTVREGIVDRLSQ